MPSQTITTERQAAYFLRQCVIGSPTYPEIQACIAAGSRTAWLDIQLARNLEKRFVDRVYTDEGIGSANNWSDGGRRNTFRSVQAAYAGDPASLRLRCLKALSTIFVCSIPGGAFNEAATYSHTGWLDRLNSQVFGNYVDLLETVSYSNQMSKMLSFYANRKATSNSQPDENYAREIMQLFTIGLWELNDDGTQRQHPVTGRPIPTYTNADIRQMARVFTGLTRPNISPASRYNVANAANDAAALVLWGGPGTTGEFSANYADPTVKLKHYVGFYETGAKVALNGYINVPANTDPVTNMRMVHEKLVAHPSCAPFVCYRLIQALVCSNPSPAYVTRVVQVFRNNGSGVAGDMKAVWRAILTDNDALYPDSSTELASPHRGRPLDGLECFYLSRALERRADTGRFHVSVDTDLDFGMEAVSDPSIFSYYDATHRTGGLPAREMQMWTAPTVVSSLDGHNSQINMSEARDSATLTQATSNYSMLPLTGTAAELTERCNVLFCGGFMSVGLRADMESVLGGMPLGSPTLRQDRVNVALQMVLASPDARVQL